MIRIIDGKRYNTETAKLLGEYSNGLSGSDFRYEREKLYRTAKGAWFLYYSGGANSIYREWDVDAYINSSGIMPLSNDEAYDWCERNRKSKVIEEYFSDKVEEA